MREAKKDDKHPLFGKLLLKKPRTKWV
jgi:hypothetical protein